MSRFGNLRFSFRTKALKRNFSQFRVLRLLKNVLIKLNYIIILAVILFHLYLYRPKSSYKVQPPTHITTDANLYFHPDSLPANEDFAIRETQDFLINTPGCHIPNYAKTFNYRSLKNKSSESNMCGVRYIVIDNLGDGKIKFRMHNYTEKGTRCCYRFAKEFLIPGHKHYQLTYTPCEVFTNNTIVRLQQEVIKVTCETSEKIIYNDVYIILKKLNENGLKSQTNHENRQWNVLIIGLDSKSRKKIFDTMPRTTKYLKKHKWLDFKGYQKVGTNTYQNLMSVLTGKRMSTVYSKCSPDLDKCADFFIWKKYEHGGYKTAHGESNLLTETFSSGFENSPTDHYTRLLLRTVTEYSSEILCAGTMPLAKHLLEYAHNFADAYKKNAFFGMFWINTYINIPQFFDTDIVDFFRKLESSGVLNNTFIIFFSDQGPTFGGMDPVQSYYENQLPMLFMWTPLEFRQYYTNKYYNLKVNQERLVTSYDVYVTLEDILKLAKNSIEDSESKACPQCSSLFEKVSPNRNCADAGIDGTCSCHNMWPVSTDDKKLENTISAVAAHIEKIRSSIKTPLCMFCAKLPHPLQKTLYRAHGHNESGKIYHVIAFYVPANKLLFESEIVFESEVVQYSGRIEVLSVRSLTRNDNRRYCAVYAQDRPFCVCVHNQTCSKMKVHK